MILGIMQPYFFPYIGYYQLMSAVDRWVVFDTVKYGRKSWVNRNRVLHPTQGWQYISVPVSSAHDGAISDATVIDADAALRRILGQLDHYRGKAPYFREVCGLVEGAFAAAQGDRLRDLNIQTLLVVYDYLGLQLNWSLFSEMNLDLPVIERPGQWALEISAAVGAGCYVNAPGGREIFEPADWDARGIDLRFLAPEPFVYETTPYDYQGGLSILDVLMWNDVEAVRRYFSERRLCA
jgi:hypothetical protein